MLVCEEADGTHRHGAEELEAEAEEAADHFASSRRFEDEDDDPAHGFQKLLGSGNNGVLAGCVYRRRAISA